MKYEQVSSVRNGVHMILIQDDFYEAKHLEREGVLPIISLLPDNVRVYEKRMATNG